MAKTLEEVEESIVESVQTSDPSLDAAKGPIRDIMIQPVAPEITRIGEEAERISRLYSLEFAEVATQAEVNALSTNYGQAQGQGRPSTGFGFFMRFTRPAENETLTVPAGTLIATQEINFIYKVVETIQLDGINAESFFNPTRGTYEIQVEIQAVANGPDYDLPPLRIIRILTEIEGFTAFENRSETAGGLGFESKENQFKRVQTRLLGLDRGNVGGIASEVSDYSPELVKDVAVIQPKDRTLFKRPIDTPALDIYVIGEEIKSTNEEFAAIGGEEQFLLGRRPVQAVDVLTVNGAEVPFSVAIDTSVEYGTSTAANDRIILPTALNTGDIVKVSYSYNSLLYEMK